MTVIGLFFGTQTGNTAAAAEQIQQEFGGESVVTLIDVAEAEPADFKPYDCLMIGCPTWNIGEMQSDWEGLYDELEAVNFAGKKVAYFGSGDQVGYADNFQDALGILEERISALGGQTVGQWPTDGYDFNASKAVKNGKFVGLALDEENQPELTESRIKAWVSQLKLVFGIH
ncbi:flavodoxin FldA [Lyngbya confervoides]|uniref:Flavodoxin n=1 Tax=Lyngbya confervoides BDU141951 TaxID=1574623 RepID=A0ABD4T3A8_9CYAN|nr:flavodoxin FldA [Lyngbya confervoides]MCM1982918.1 flavodoxin FldA [Lyngbya confervoides BDU141951]